jgi:hypothetical protein
LKSKKNRIKIFFISAATITLLGGFIAAGGVSFSFLVCPLRELVGLPCLTEWMTRSFKVLFAGRIFESLRLNPFGLPLALFCLVSLVFLIVELLTGTDIYSAWFKRNCKTILASFFTPLFIYYLFTVWLEWKTGALTVFFRGSLLNDLLGLL